MEQLFYFCFPFLAVCFKKNQKLLMLFILLLVLTVCGMYFTPEENIKGYWYVNPIARIPDFIVGMLLFRFYTYLIDKKMTYRTGTLLEISSIVIFLFFYLYAADVPKVYRYTCYYWFPVALLLLSFSLQKGFVSRLLSNRFLIIGGEISYSFYLIHLFVLLSYAEWQKGSASHIDWYISIPILFSVTILLSLLSYYYFEKPMNKLVKTLLNK